MYEVTAVTNAVLTPTSRIRYPFGVIGLILGVAGLIATVTGPHIATALKPHESPPQEVSDILADAGDKFVGRMLARARGQTVESAAELPPPTPWGWYFSSAAALLGLAGAVSGMVGWVRREDNRLATGAMPAGLLAVAWMYIIAALVIALVVMFLLVMLSALGE